MKRTSQKKEREERQKKWLKGKTERKITGVQSTLDCAKKRIPHSKSLQIAGRLEPDRILRRTKRFRASKEKFGHQMI